MSAVAWAGLAIVNFAMAIGNFQMAAIGPDAKLNRFSRVTGLFAVVAGVLCVVVALSRAVGP